MWTQKWRDLVACDGRAATGETMRFDTESRYGTGKCCVAGCLMVFLFVPLLCASASWWFEFSTASGLPSDTIRLAPNGYDTRTRLPSNGLHSWADGGGPRWFVSLHGHTHTHTAHERFNLKKKEKDWKPGCSSSSSFPLRFTRKIATQTADRWRSDLFVASILYRLMTGRPYGNANSNWKRKHHRYNAVQKSPKTSISEIKCRSKVFVNLCRYIDKVVERVHKLHL